MSRIQKSKILVSILLIQSLLATNLFFYTNSISVQDFNQTKTDLVYNVQSSTITGTIFDSSQLNNLPARLLETASEKNYGNGLSGFIFETVDHEINLSNTLTRLNSTVRFDRVIASNSLFKLFCSFKIPSA
jgi:hypothetical protein